MKKTIIFVLILSMTIIICHDLLHNHSHQSNHCNIPTHNRDFHEYLDKQGPQEHVHDCDGNHQQCNICQNNYIPLYEITQQFQLEYFPLIIPNVSIDQNIKQKYVITLISDRYLFKKSLLYQSPSTFRGPPSLV